MGIYVLTEKKTNPGFTKYMLETLMISVEHNNATAFDEVA